MSNADRNEQNREAFKPLDQQWLEGDDPGTYPATSDETAELDRQMSGLDVYMARLRQLDPLSAEKQAELARRYIEEANQKAGELLIMTNLRLVIKLAKDYTNDWDEIFELIQEGNVGISKALGHYDPSKNVKFTSYAQYWIRARILDYLINRGRTIRLGTSRAGRKLFYNLNDVRERLRNEGVEPTPERIAEELDVDVQDVVQVGRQMDESPVSLDQPLSDDGNRTVGDLMEAAIASPEEATANQQAVGTIRRALRQFGEQLTDDRRRTIWYERVVAENRKYLRELGDDWDVSKERIRQIEKELHAEFRGFFRREVGGSDELKNLFEG